MDQSSFPKNRLLSAIVLAVLTAPSCHAVGSPFVSGFERFARHDEISRAMAGRLLLSELSCTACHRANSSVSPKRGPVLDAVGNRINHQWLKQFLLDPEKVSPGTTMPNMLAGLSERQKQDTAAALVAFLKSRQKPFPEIKGTGARPVPLEFWNRGDPERGRQLYHRIGCVACHQPDADYETVETKPTPLEELLEQLDPEQLEEVGLSAAARRVKSVPHGDLTAKYSRRSLTFFLMNPHSVRPSGRMPHFQLTVDQAADLTAWLLKDQTRQSQTSGKQSATSDQKLVEKGAQLFQSIGCVNCHQVGDLKPRMASKSLIELNLDAATHCLDKPSKGIAHYSLDPAQRAAIAAALQPTATAQLARLAPADEVQFVLLKLNCLACHERQKRGGIGRYRKAYFETYGHIDIGDEGRLPPPLTGVGRKLKSSWTTKVLQGAGNIRPHMRIRMPVFPPAEVEQLPEQMSFVDVGRNKKQPTEKEVFGDLSQLAEAGRQLLDTGCVQCHPVRTESLPGVVGVDLAGITGRVQPDWFRSFLLNPVDLKPRTRMPTFFPDGKSQNSIVLEGNAERQIAAMWAYLKDINRQKLPAKIEIARSQDYELVPTQRPSLLRTFMDQAGTHAIAVGFPEKTHFAYDAENVYPAFAWRGRFLDARGTWFERFTPPAKPLGSTGVSLPQGVSVALPNGAEEPWPLASDASQMYRYLGHRLDKSGVPVFRYQLQQFLIEERIFPHQHGLSRTITIASTGSDSKALQLLAHSGKELTLAGAECSSETGLRVSLPDIVASQGRIVTRGGVSQWRVPITVEERKTIEVHYRW